MTEDPEKFALHLINNPPPGSQLAKAKECGVDLTLFISTLRRSPTERARSLSEGARIFQIAKQTHLSEKWSSKKRFAYVMRRGGWVVGIQLERLQRLVLGGDAELASEGELTSATVKSFFG